MAEDEQSHVKEALKRDLEQTEADLTGGRKGKDLNQNVGDTVKQATGKEPVPPAGVPNADPDDKVHPTPGA